MFLDGDNYLSLDAVERLINVMSDRTYDNLCSIILLAISFIW